MTRPHRGWFALTIFAVLGIAGSLANAAPAPLRPAAPADATSTPIPVGDNHPFVVWTGTCQVAWWLPVDPWLHTIWVEKNGVRTELIPNVAPQVDQPVLFNMGSAASVRWGVGSPTVRVQINGIIYDKPWADGPYNREVVTWGLTYSISRTGPVNGPVTRIIQPCGDAGPPTLTPTNTVETPVPTTPVPTTAVPTTAVPTTAVPTTPPPPTTAVPTTAVPTTPPPPATTTIPTTAVPTTPPPPPTTPVPTTVVPTTPPPPPTTPVPTTAVPTTPPPPPTTRVPTTVVPTTPPPPPTTRVPTTVVPTTPPPPPTTRVPTTVVPTTPPPPPTTRVPTTVVPTTPPPPPTTRVPTTVVPTTPPPPPTTRVPTTVVPTTPPPPPTTPVPTTAVPTTPPPPPTTRVPTTVVPTTPPPPPTTRVPTTVVPTTPPPPPTTRVPTTVVPTTPPPPPTTPVPTTAVPTTPPPPPTTAVPTTAVPTTPPPPTTPIPTTAVPTTPPSTPTPSIFVPPPYLPRPLPCLRAGYADFVLVMDVSTSMLRETSSGAIKQDVVIQAARDFVRLLSLDPDQQTGGSDQLAVVWFNDNTGQEQALTNNRAALTAAIDRLPGRTAQGTRLDKAFLAGAAAFASPTRQNSNQPVIILLTDGLPNRVPIPPGGTQEDTVLAAADKAKALGIQIFTIGVGDPDAPDIVDRVNPELLAACASDPSMSFIAPEPEDLAEIYQQIASTFCASGGGTPRPYRIYIPVYYWTNDPLPKPTLCPRSSYADFVLVMDVSTSMLRKTAAGNIKRDVVLAAAKDFVSLLSLDPEPGSGRSDQLAVVWFNDATGVEQGLTSNRPALRDAVNRLPGRTGQGTRLDLAFQAGAAALKSPLRRAENQPVMIVLTDGLPNRVPAPPGGTQEDTVIAAAAAAKAEGIMVFTIGVGRPDAPDLVDRVNPALLAACASQPEMSFIAPEAEDLAKIYGQIVKVFCTSSKIMRPFRTAGPRWFGKMEPVRSE